MTTRKYRCPNGHDVAMDPPYDKFTCPCGAEAREVQAQVATAFTTGTPSGTVVIGSTTGGGAVLEGPRAADYPPPDPQVVRLLSLLHEPARAHPTRTYWAALVACSGASMLVGLLLGYWLHG